MAIHYAFVVLGVTFITLVIGAGVRATPGVLMAALESDFGWERDLISGAVSVNILLLGCLGPFVVAMLQAWGLARVVALSLLLVGGGVALVSAMTPSSSAGLLYLFWGLMTGLGSVAVGTVLGAVVVDSWLAKHKSLVLGFFSASNATGSLLFAPPLAYIVSHAAAGWRAAVWVMGGAALATAPLVLLFLRSKPGDMGLLPYGAAEAEVQPADSIAADSVAADSVKAQLTDSDAAPHDEAGPPPTSHFDAALAKGDVPEALSTAGLAATALPLTVSGPASAATASPSPDYTPQSCLKRTADGKDASFPTDDGASSALESCDASEKEQLVVGSVVVAFGRLDGAIATTTTVSASSVSLQRPQPPPVATDPHHPPAAPHHPLADATASDDSIAIEGTAAGVVGSAPSSATCETDNVSAADYRTGNAAAEAVEPGSSSCGASSGADERTALPLLETAVSGSIQVTQAAHPAVPASSLITDDDASPAARQSCAPATASNTPSLLSTPSPAAASISSGEPPAVCPLSSSSLPSLSTAPSPSPAQSSLSQSSPSQCCPSTSPAASIPAASHAAPLSAAAAPSVPAVSTAASPSVSSAAAAAAGFSSVPAVSTAASPSVSSAAAAGFSSVPAVSAAAPPSVSIAVIPAPSSCLISSEDVQPSPVPPPAPAAVPAAAKSNPAKAALAALKEGASSPDFWLLAGSFWTCGASTNGLIGTHFIPACVDAGMGEVAAAGLLSAMGGLDIAGTIASGWLADRVDSRALLCAYYGFRGIALAFLPSALGMPADSMDAGLWPYAVVYGLDWIATVPPTKRLCDACFPGKGAMIFSWCLAAHQIGAAMAAAAAGAVRTHNGNYDGAFYFSAGLCILTAVAVWGIRSKGRGNTDNDVHSTLKADRAPERPRVAVS